MSLFLSSCRFKHKQEKGAFIQLMQVFLPILHNRCVSLMKDESAAAALIQAKILKIFRGLIQVRYCNMFM